MAGRGRLFVVVVVAGAGGGVGALLQLLQLLLLAGQRHGRVVVEALRHQLQRQRVLLSRRLLDLRALVLEPDLDLRLVQSQLAAQLLPPPLSQVAVLGELVLRGAGKVRSFRDRAVGGMFKGITFNRASWGPLNAVRGRFSSAAAALAALSLGVFLGLLVRGPSTKQICN